VRVCNDDILWCDGSEQCTSVVYLYVSETYIYEKIIGARAVRTAGVCV